MHITLKRADHFASFYKGHGNFRCFKIPVNSRKIICQVLKNASDERTLNELITIDDIFKKVDVETIAAMNLFAGTDIEYEEKEEVINVCKAWEDHKKLGIQQGENKMLFTLVTKGKLDIDTAAEEAGVSVSEFEKLMSEAGYKVPETV